MDIELCHKILKQLYALPSKITQLQQNLDFFIIGGTKGARWLIPYHSAQAHVVLRQWQPYGKKSGFLWYLLLMLYRCQLLSWLPNVKQLKWRTSITLDKTALLNNPEHATLIPVIYLGTPNATRKAVVMLVDDKHKKIRKVLKLALTPEANVKILHEANILEQLQQAKFPAPQILQCHIQGNFSIQQALLGQLSKRYFTEQHLNYLLTLRINQTTDLTTHIQVLLTRLEYITINQKIFLQDWLIQIQDKTALSMVCEHGDFAPWNLKQTAHGLQAIDWEDAIIPGLPLQDALHFFTIQAYLFGEPLNFLQHFFKSPPIMDYCKAFDISRSLAKLLAQYYLIATLIKCYQNNQSKQIQFLYSILRETDWKGL